MNAARKTDAILSGLIRGWWQAPSIDPDEVLHSVGGSVRGRNAVMVVGAPSRSGLSDLFCIYKGTDHTDLEVWDAETGHFISPERKDIYDHAENEIGRELGVEV